MRPNPRVVPLLFVTAALSGAAAAQSCALTWAPGEAYVGIDRWAYDSVMWDPDGAGPATEKLLIVGGFSVAGDQAVENAVLWDPSTGGYVGGLAADVEPIPVFTVLTSIRHVVPLAGGDLLAAGSFHLDGTTALFGRYDGVSWSRVDAGLTNASVTGVVQLPNGDLVATGTFVTTTAVNAGVVRWDGATWSVMLEGTGSALLQAANGDLVAAGTFVGQSSNVVRYDGVAWSDLGAGTDVPADVLYERANGDLVAGGSFTTADGNPAVGVATWSGASWSSLGAGGAGGVTGGVRAIAEDALGGLFVGGTITQADGVPVTGLVRWSGAAWSTLRALQPVGADVAREHRPGDVEAHEHVDAALLDAARDLGAERLQQREQGERHTDREPRPPARTERREACRARTHRPFEGASRHAAPPPQERRDGGHGEQDRPRAGVQPAAHACTAHAVDPSMRPARRSASAARTNHEKRSAVS